MVDGQALMDRLKSEFEKDGLDVSPFSKGFYVDELKYRENIGDLFQSLETIQLEVKESRKYEDSADEMGEHIELCQRVYDTCCSDIEMLANVQIDSDETDPNSLKVIALASLRASISHLRATIYYEVNIEGASLDE